MTPAQETSVLIIEREGPVAIGVDGDREPPDIRVEGLVSSPNVGRLTDGFLTQFEPLDRAALRLSRPDMRRGFAPI